MAHANDTVQGTRPGTCSADAPTAALGDEQAPAGTLVPEHAASTSEPGDASGEVSDDERPDAVSGATVTAASAETQPSGNDAPGGSGAEPETGSDDATADSDDSPKASDAPDTITGATPGVAAACRDYGFTSPDTVDLLLGVKPPGQR